MHLIYEVAELIFLLNISNFRGNYHIKYVLIEITQFPRPIIAKIIGKYKKFRF